MATIEEYRKQKILAEQLRKREAALGAAMQSGDPTLVTRGSRGATYDMPDIYQANVAGALAKASGGFLAGRAGRQATNAETSAEEKRQAALEQVLGAAGVAGGTMTPQQAIQLQELGVEVDVGDFLPKAKTPAAPGAILQGIQAGLPPAIVQKLARGEDLTPDEIAAVQKAQRDKYDREFQDKLRLKQTGAASSTSNTPLTMKQLEAAALTKVMSATTPEEKKAAEEELARIRGKDTYSMGAGEKKTLSTLVKTQGDSDRVVQNMDRLLGIIDEGKAFKGARNTISSGAKEFSERLGEHLPLVGAVSGIVHDVTASPEIKQFDVLTMDAVLRDMGKLGGNDSNQELARIASRYPKAIQDPATARAIATELKNFSKIASRAAALEAEDMRSGKYVEPGDPTRGNYHTRAAEELGLTQYLSDSLPPVPKVTEAAPAPAQGDTPVPGYEDIWAKMTPEEKAEARK